jgi:hypothetical protein
MHNLIFALALLAILPACTCTTIPAKPDDYQQWLDEIDCRAEQDDQLTCEEAIA